MPLHDHRCINGHVFEAFIPLDMLQHILACPQCGKDTERVFLRAPLVRGDLPGYESPVTGKWIEGRRARIEDLKQTGCRPYDEGEKEAYTRRRAVEEQDFDKRLDATIDQTIQEMPIQKRDKLAAEMESGVDVVVARATPNMGQSTN